MPQLYRTLPNISRHESAADADHEPRGDFVFVLEQIERGKDPITERNLRSIVAVADWKKQRRMWRYLEERLETG